VDLNMARQGDALARFLTPNPFFLGIVFAFLCCSIGGRAFSQRNPYREFSRLHVFLNPENLYYPTAGQLCALARERLTPDKIAVIVGGSSRLHGTGQRPSGVWTLRLQTALGPRFEVINFGVRSASSWEIGATAAEILSQEYSRLILITDCEPGLIVPHPDGNKFKYFFWGAYYKGLLLHDSERDKLADQNEEDAALNVASTRDIRLRAWLDGLFYFDDLWNTCAYRCFCTVRTPATMKSSLLPRRKYEDPESGAQPYEKRYVAWGRDQMLSHIRRLISGTCVKGVDGEWAEDTSSTRWALFDQSARACYPEVLHRQTLFVIAYHSPWYISLLSEDERGCLIKSGEISVAKLRSHGYGAVEVGRGYTPSDYADLQHFSESGGEKMARAVAQEVRAIAKNLNFIEKEEQ
jgi:hypothetical protein